MTRHVVEWAPFNLRDGIEEAELMQRSARLQTEFLARQGGFIRRELLKAADGGYVDLVWWESMEAAQAAMTAAAANPACESYFAVMGADHGDPGAGVLTFRSVKVYT